MKPERRMDECGVTSGTTETYRCPEDYNMSDSCWESVSLWVTKRSHGSQWSIVLSFCGICTTLTRQSIMWVSRWPPAKRLYATTVWGESDKRFLYELNILNAINPVTLQCTKPRVLITEQWVTMSNKVCSSTGGGIIEVGPMLCQFLW